jgi:ubiquinone/menaquinone biosynthesis C-methylase UbiE
MYTMHEFARRHHGAGRQTPTEGSAQTKGLILNGGRGYDLSGWLFDTFLFRGQWRALRRRTIALADIQPGERVLDVGCGTGTLALEAQRRVVGVGRVVGIDPSTTQIAHARAKAARRRAPVEFQIGAIERLPFADATFDVVLSTLMMHHLPAPIKRQGLAEIARVLAPGGRLVIADFTRKQERQGRAARFHAGGSKLDDLVALARATGFDDVETEAMPPMRGSAFPGASFVVARKRS